MMGSDFYFRDKIPVAVLGATGIVGQMLVQLLAYHPWFEIIALCDREPFVGQSYKQSVQWTMPISLPSSIADLSILPCEPTFACSLVFSCLPDEAGTKIVEAFASTGYPVIANHLSNSLQATPLMVAEVNTADLSLFTQKFLGKGFILAVPSCAITSLALALKPLKDQFKIEWINVFTLHSVGDANGKTIPSLDSLENSQSDLGEEENIHTQLSKILGKVEQGKDTDFPISANCYRIPVSRGFRASVSIKFKQTVTSDSLIKVWSEFTALPQQLQLPTAPTHPIHYFDQSSRVQMRLQSSFDKEMAISIGQLRPCPLGGYKFSVISNDTMRGAAGDSLLIAELLVKEGFIYW